MSELAAGLSGQWLALREGPDAAARASDLVGLAAPYLPRVGTTVVHDLGSGSGSMARWLAPLLPGPQHWVLHDRDPSLLALAAADPPRSSRDGADITVETRLDDVAALGPAGLAGAHLVTASALLDMLTRTDVEHIVDSCTEARCPALFALTVVGEVRLEPADPLDSAIAEAFNAHQRRSIHARRLLGPDAAGAATAAFAARGAEVVARSTPWLLGAAQGDLLSAWCRGWVRAACEQRPELAGSARPYLHHRLAQASAGGLRASVGHRDLLALPR